MMDCTEDSSNAITIKHPSSHTKTENLCLPWKKLNNMTLMQES